MAAIGGALLLEKEKITPSGVLGKITCLNACGERIGPWGGTECYLHRQSGIGPCLVVRASKHKRHEGTCYRLTDVQKVLADYCSQGKLTVITRYQSQVCTLLIAANANDIPQLTYMARLLQTPARWGEMEVDVSAKAARGGGRQRASKEGGGTLRESGPSSFTSAAAGYAPHISHAHPLHQGGGVDDADDDVDPNELLATRLGLASGVPAMAVAQQMIPPTSTAASAVAVAGFSPEQVAATTLVKKGHNVFITGGAGTGKSFWLRNLIDHVLPKHTEGVAITASTGIAARAIGGQTVHAFAGIGRGDAPFEQLLQRIRNRPEVVRTWTACRVWIMDEVGMLSAELMTTLDRIARAIKKRPNDPFGGIQVVAVGDFYQLPPVVVDGTKEIFAFESPSWGACGFRHVEFSVQFRHAQDMVFSRICRDLRVGYVSVEAEDALRKCTPSQRKKDGRLTLDAETMTHIMPLRKQVDAYNQEQLSLIEDPTFLRYEAEDQTSVPGLDLDAETPLMRSLMLKIGSLVVAVAAVPNTPIRNGDVGTVVGFQEQSHGPPLPVVRLDHHHEAGGGEAWPIGLVRVDVAGRGGASIASRTQLPLLLAWALTVHRVQGMTLPAAFVTLDASVFCSGQAYVAISRVRSLDDLMVSDAFTTDAFAAHPKVQAFMQRAFQRTRAELAEEQARRDQDAFIRSSRREQQAMQHSLTKPKSRSKNAFREVPAEEPKPTTLEHAVIQTPTKKRQRDDGQDVVGISPEHAYTAATTAGSIAEETNADEISVPTSPMALPVASAYHFEERAMGARSPGKRTAFSFSRASRSRSVSAENNTSKVEAAPRTLLLMDDEEES